MNNRLQISIFNRYRNQFYKEQLTKWELKKSYKDYTVQIDLNTPFRFDNKTAYKYLLDMAVKGPYNLENTPVTDTLCGVSIPARVYSVEGEADHKNMIFDKTPDLNGQIRFDEKANIFDYDDETLIVFDGVTDTRGYSKSVDNPDLIDDYDSLLQLLDVPNFEGEGFYLTRILIKIEPVLYTEVGQDLDFLDYYTYKATCVYTRYSSTVALDGWLPFGNVFVFQFPVLEPRRQVIDTFLVDDGSIISSIRYSGFTQISNVSDQSVSNARDFNQLLDDVFSGDYVSNFFDINSDASNPDNKYYQFASDYCHHLKIIQGRDVTSANAENDSFGDSGKLFVEKVIADLNNMFNLILVYDPTTDKIRHEHISYWRSKRITLTDYDLKPYKFNSSRISAESWKMPVDSLDSEHNGTEISYRIPTNQDKNYPIEVFLTDVANFLNTASDSIENQDKLFFLVSTDGNGNINAFNRPLSIRNLVQKLHDLNRPSRQGIQDNDNVTFQASSIGMETEIQIHSTLATFINLMPQMGIVLPEGTFFIDELTIDQSGLITIPVSK